MKTFGLCLLVALLPFLGRAQYTITNVNIGTDSNSVAWTKVNANNGNFVAWMNSLTLTNALTLSAISNVNAQLTNFAATAWIGTYYPSNTWALASITNNMPNFSFWEGNSNGQARVSVYLSNGVAWIKKLAP